MTTIQTTNNTNNGNGAQSNVMTWHIGDVPAWLGIVGGIVSALIVCAVTYGTMSANNRQMQDDMQRLQLRLDAVAQRLDSVASDVAYMRGVLKVNQ